MTTNKTIDQIKEDYAQEWGAASWFELVEDCDPQLMDNHINRIATRYALEMADKRQMYAAAAQGIISALYGNQLQAEIYKTQWAEKYGHVTAMQATAMAAMEWASTLHNHFNKEAIC